MSEARRRWDLDLWWVVVRHQGDARSDLSAVHHLRWDEVLELPADEFGGLVSRLMHYPGAVQATALAAYRKSKGEVADQAPAPEESGVPVDPTPEQVRAMRDAARRRKFDPAKYGEHKHVGIDQFMTEASRG